MYKISGKIFFLNSKIPIFFLYIFPKILYIQIFYAMKNLFYAMKFFYKPKILYIQIFYAMKFFYKSKILCNEIFI